MKKWICMLLSIAMVFAFALFAMGSGEDSNTNQGEGSVSCVEDTDNALGQYSLTIDSCRLAKDYQDKDVVIVKYTFTNNGDEAQSFSIAFDDAVFQNGVGLNEAFVLAESANYSEDNQTKEIKKGSSIEVEVAYDLNDTTTDIDVEVKELLSFSDKTLTKTFKIAK